MAQLRKLLFACVGVATLASCAGEAEPSEPVQERDPLIVQALNAPLMTDPDLTSLNEANAALTIGYNQSLPTIDRSADTIAAARDAARLRLIEMGEIRPLPQATKQADLPSLGKALTSEQRADWTTFARSCASAVQYSAAWAGQLPEFAEIISRGAVVEAAGSDTQGCRLRSITYLTPLPAEDVLGFHFNMAAHSGLQPKLLQGDEQAIVGAGKAGKLAVHLSDRDDGLIAVHIVALLNSDSAN